ncbi:hypothetical protein EYF80_027328 [Liparis tanakae]|uniref:Uncharacterized protein n=1 Tax=Liparis tanakae TaxID=230148 RepID=A0A4Z2HA77_9TELE|nr:hypothetical protein EYF80_027328 [Liparis tanakae]
MYHSSPAASGPPRDHVVWFASNWLRSEYLRWEAATGQPVTDVQPQLAPVRVLRQWLDTE